MAKDDREVVKGDRPLVDGGFPLGEEADTRKQPGSAVALQLLLQHAGTRQLLVLESGERRAEEAARALAAFAGDDVEVLLFPPWDTLPYDRAAPSRESMGRRMAVLQALCEPVASRRILVTSPAAAMQRVPTEAACGLLFDIAVGDRLDREALQAFCHAAGYCEDDRIDEPGEVAFLGEVVDVYPPAEALPIRIDIDAEDRVADLRIYDPASQRSLRSVASVRLTPASEGGHAVPAAEAQVEAETPSDAPPLATLFERMGEAEIVLEDGVVERCAEFIEQIEDAYQAALQFGDAERPAPPAALYLSLSELPEAVTNTPPLDVSALRPVPRFSRQARPQAALRDYVNDLRAQGRRIALAGLEHELRVLGRSLRRTLGESPTPLNDLDAVLAAEPAAFVSITADLDGGFEAPSSGLVVLTPTDIVGGRIARPDAAPPDLLGEAELRIGDAVIHEDHGLGVLEALERITAEDQPRDVLRLGYHGGTTLLAPVEELSRIWRYGSEPSAVTLDRLNGSSWAKRRAEVSAQIDAAAAALVEAARQREAARTDPIHPPKAAFARFAARFPYPESIDQAAAIGAVLDDLASGRPMNRLVCGDVGFGKTEVALRAAAAAALCGLQVMVAAPTTVLARQHYETFRRRFEGTGVVVAQLSRLVDDAEAQAVRQGLADGTFGVVVGTQALAEGVELAKPGLVIIDEEHRFGARLKAQLGAAAPHVLSLSATPIPRTLQGALVGIQDVSVIASPPARRRPIRTALTPFDAGAVRTALVREKARGGQSFVVVPRVADIAPMRDRLAELAPELEVVVAHGKRAVEEMDAVMVGFAAGRGDVLLATNIIENGLDVPRANTMLIWRPDRFGLAQLHQLRGRVGRGRRQGAAYLLTEPDETMAEATRARLATLEALDRLGAGFALSARDLDLRGGGDLVGEEQAGHIQLIGAGLYQRVLARALRVARGEPEGDPAPPPISIAGGGLPEDYIPDPSVRISLYARLARAVDVEALDALAEEMEDRFGVLPEETVALLARRRLTALAIAAGITQVATGPKASALTVAQDRIDHLSSLPIPAGGRWSDNRLIFDCDGEPHDAAFLEDVLARLAA
jgi:transcription-repair coupling factor (superfamily II helicase)